MLKKRRKKLKRVMQIKGKNKVVLLLLIILLIITGCKKENHDALKFKEEYEKYNDTLTKVDIDENNPFIYINEKDINSLIENEKALVLFYGNPEDNSSRQMVMSIISSSKKGLGKVYYIEAKDNETYDVNGTKINSIPSMVAIVRKNLYSVVTENENINSVIETVIVELNTCDIDVGC